MGFDSRIETTGKTVNELVAQGYEGPCKIRTLKPQTELPLNCFKAPLIPSCDMCMEAESDHIKLNKTLTGARTQHFPQVRGLVTSNPLISMTHIGEAGQSRGYINVKSRI